MAIIDGSRHGGAGGRRRGGHSSVRGKERFLSFDWGPLVIEGLTDVDQTARWSPHHGEDTRQNSGGCTTMVSRARRGLPPHPVSWQGALGHGEARRRILVTRGGRRWSKRLRQGMVAAMFLGAIGLAR